MVYQMIFIDHSSYVVACWKELSHWDVPLLKHMLLGAE